MIYNILAAVLTAAFVLLVFGSAATLWMRHQARQNYRCPCGRTYQHRVEALRHEQAQHGRPVEDSQIEVLP